MNNFNNKNVLITGISGFIGSALANKLLDEGANVIGLTRNSNYYDTDILSRIHNESKIYIGDIRDYKLLCEIISDNEIDVIYHLAAYSIVRKSSRDPYTTYDVNIMGTVNLLEAARNVGKTVKRIVVSSSDKAYGDHDELPYTESFALLPNNTYDTSKACVDMIARSYAKNYGMNVVVTRCSNVYGPGDMNISRLIPNTIRKLYEGLDPEIYTTALNMEREFIYIDDVVDAYLLLGDNYQYSGYVFNIGGNGPSKILSVIETITWLFCKKYHNNDPDKFHVNTITKPSYFKEIQNQYIDASRLKELYGWEPLHVNIESGIERTIDWYMTLWSDGIQG